MKSYLSACANPPMLRIVTQRHLYGYLLVRACISTADRHKCLANRMDFYLYSYRTQCV